MCNLSQLKFDSIFSFSSLFLSKHCLEHSEVNFSLSFFHSLTAQHEILRSHKEATRQGTEEEKTTMKRVNVRNLHLEKCFQAIFLMKFCNCNMSICFHDPHCQRGIMTVNKIYAKFNRKHSR